MKQLSMQQAFNRVAVHLLTQRKRSWDPEESMCMYRGPGGLKCALGVLIKDEHYRACLEGQGANEARVQKALARSGISYSADTTVLLSALQSLHDDDDIKVNDWAPELRRIARDYGLSTDAIRGMR